MPLQRGEGVHECRRGCREQGGELLRWAFTPVPWGICSCPHEAAVEAASVPQPGPVTQEKSWERTHVPLCPSAAAHTSCHPRTYFSSVLLIRPNQDTPFKVEEMLGKANGPSTRLITDSSGSVASVAEMLGASTVLPM